MQEPLRTLQQLLDIGISILFIHFCFIRIIFQFSTLKNHIFFTTLNDIKFHYGSVNQSPLLTLVCFLGKIAYSTLLSMIRKYKIVLGQSSSSVSHFCPPFFYVHTQMHSFAQIILIIETTTLKNTCVVSPNCIIYCSFLTMKSWKVISVNVCQGSDTG